MDNRSAIVGGNSGQKELRHMLERSKDQLAAALPKHITPERMMRLALTEFNVNPQLQQCTTQSILAGVMQAAQLGLEIGLMGQAYLVPYNNRKKGVKEAQFIPGYKGLVALARRSGDVTSIRSEIVYERDEFSIELGLEERIVHKPLIDGDRGKPRLVYAIAQFKDGGHHFEWMTIKEVNSIRSRSKASDNGPWVTDYTQMVRKTVIRRMANYLPMSIELSNAIALSDAADDGKQTIIDGDVVRVVGDEPQTKQNQAIENNPSQSIKHPFAKEEPELGPSIEAVRSLHAAGDVQAARMMAMELGPDAIAELTELTAAQAAGE